MSEIERLRARIDEIDREILRLLDERMEVALRIGEVKARLNVPIPDPAREMEVLERAGEFRPVFEAILEVSRDVQRIRILQQNKRD
ncbi:MAG: chorismate mutase [Thermococcus sp.]|nr:chorismate mutase [Thermococcus sp.]